MRASAARRGRVQAFAVFALFAAATLTSCDEHRCTEIVERTALFSDYERDKENPGEFVPVGYPIAWAEEGEYVEVVRRSDLKDQVIFRVRRREGQEGYIFYEPGLGRFGVSERCKE